MDRYSEPWIGGAGFVAAASPRQLRLFGIQPPWHSYWTTHRGPSTKAMLDGVARRYPGFDPGQWRSAQTLPLPATPGALEAR